MGVKIEGFRDAPAGAARSAPPGVGRGPKIRLRIKMPIRSGRAGFWDDPCPVPDPLSGGALKRPGYAPAVSETAGVCTKGAPLGAPHFVPRTLPCNGHGEPPPLAEAATRPGASAEAARLGGRLAAGRVPAVAVDNVLEAHLAADLALAAALELDAAGLPGRRADPVRVVVALLARLAALRAARARLVGTERGARVRRGFGSMAAHGKRTERGSDEATQYPSPRGGAGERFHEAVKFLTIHGHQPPRAVMPSRRTGKPRGRDK